MSQRLLYKIADGKGGTATGTLTIHSLATGKYGGTATDAATPPALPGVLTITIGEKNAITATFVENKHLTPRS